MEKVRAGALRGLAYRLDPYSTYLTPDHRLDYTRRPTEINSGGNSEPSCHRSHRYLYVVAPMKNAPADVAGVKAGDVVEYIDGKATRDISLYDANSC